MHTVESLLSRRSEPCSMNVRRWPGDASALVWGAIRGHGLVKNSSVSQQIDIMSANSTMP